MTPWVSGLLIVNILVYALTYALPGLGNYLVYVPSLMLKQPWGILTYMFVHGGFTHILFNMLGLYFFGPRLELRLGSSRFAQLYFVSGITGALLQTAMAPNVALLGASAGVFGVMLGFASFWPKETIYIYGVIPVEARILVIITTVLTLYSGLSGSNGGTAHFAHLGGYAGAWVYLRVLARNAGAGARQFAAQQYPATKVPERALADRITTINFDGVHALNREEINRILDKISAQGMASLSATERTFLLNFVPPDDRKKWTA